MKSNLLLIGSGQHANVVIYNAREQNKVCIKAIADIDSTKWGTTINGIRVVDKYEDFNKEDLEFISRKYKVKKFFIGLGSMKVRRRLFDFMLNEGWESVNIIHPNAVVSKTAKLGSGILIEAGCLVTPSPIIGNNVVINTGSQVNHDNIINDHVYIASGVILSGGVEIGENTLIDDGVVVTLGRKIGRNCIVGAGSVVTKDIPDNVIAYGNPCKVIRENDKY